MGNSFLAECNKGISETEVLKIPPTIQYFGRGDLKKNPSKPSISQKSFQNENISCPQRSASIDKIYQKLRNQKSISYSIESQQILNYHGVKDLKQLLLKQTNSSRLTQLSQRNNESLSVDITPQSSETNGCEFQNQIRVKNFILKTQNQRESSFSSEMEKNIIRNRSSSQSFSDFNLRDGSNIFDNPHQIIETESFSIFFKNYIYVGYLNPLGRPHGPGQLYHFQKNSQNQEVMIFIEAEFTNGSISTDDMIIIFRDDSYYRGGFHESAFNGKGRLKLNKSLELMGNFMYGLLEGKGKAIYPDGGTYQGSFKAGIRQGKGKMVWKSQKSTEKQSPLEICYQGFFKDDKMNGLGYLRTPNYEYWGPFSNNIKEGKGTIKFKDGNKFEGWFERDQISGYGQLHYSNGDVERGIFPIEKNEK